MSHPEAPNGPSFDGQNEAAAPPPPEVVTSHAGAAAVQAETQSQEPTVGEATLGQIRDMFRDGTVRRHGVAQRPEIVKNNPDQYEQMVQTAARWRSQHHPDDKIADEVSHRLTGAWVKVAVARGDSTFLGDESRLTSALSFLYSDANHAVNTLGLKGVGVVSALFNSRQELEAAKQLVEQSPFLRPSDFKTCAEQVRSDVLGAVQQTNRNVKAVVNAVRDGTIPRHELLSRKVIIEKAIRQRTEEGCVDTVGGYVTRVEVLAKQYEGHRTLTPTRIAVICSNTSNPEKAIDDKLEDARSLTAQFLGRGGLAKRDIEEVVFKNKNPRKVLLDTIRDAEIVDTALEGKLIPSIVRRLVMQYEKVDDSIEAGRQTLSRANDLKRQLAGNAEVQAVFSDADFVKFVHYEQGTPEEAARFAHRVVTAREHFRNNPQASEAIIRKASREDGDVVQNTNTIIQSVHHLGTQLARDNVPHTTVEEAVTKSGDAKRHTDDFIRNRDNAVRQFGGRLPMHLINKACSQYANPLDKLGRLMAIRNRRERIPATEPGTDEDARHSDDSDVRPYNTDTIITDMQRHSREHRRGGSRAHLDESYREHINQVREQIADWVDDFISINEGIDQNRVVDRFTRMYYNYIRYGEELDLTTDPQMLRAVFEDYCNYVRELARHKFENPEAVAQFNPRKKVLEQSADRTKELRRVMRDNFGSVDSNRLLGNRLRNRFPGKVDAEFQDRLDALSDDERALINNRLRDQADPEEERRLRERLRTDDLDDYYNDLLRYLKLRDDTESRPTSPPTAPNGPASPPHPVYDRYNEEQRRRDTAPATGGGQGSLVQEVKSDLDRAMYILEEEFANGAVARAVDRLDAGIVGLSGAAMRAQAAIEDLERRQRSLNVDIAYAENHTPEGQTGPDEALVQRLYAQNEAIKAELRTLRAMQSGVNSAIGSLSDAIDHANHSRGVSQTIVGDVKAYRTDI